MGEVGKEYLAAMKVMLKPEKWKLIAFALLIVALMLVPMYPTKATYYPDHPSLSDPSDSYTVYSALIFLIITNFQYEYSEGFEISYEIGNRPTIDPTTVYEASTTFLFLYILIIPLIYILGCYSVEKIRWKKKNVYPSGVRDL